MKVALVLSGGGRFGAWQAGAWRRLCDSLSPDLVVGASAGALNGYAIASGAGAEELCAWWRRPEFTRFRETPQLIRSLTARGTPRVEFATVITDAVRMKPVIVRAPDVTWRHLTASCAVPLLLPPQKIDRGWYVDGGLLNPLPVWAAIELGATHIVALHALPEIPSAVMKPFVSGFRRAFGHNPPVPAGIEVRMLEPSVRLGSMRDALVWSERNADRWIEQGFADAQNISIPARAKR
jgi:NTE family protein